MKVLIAVADKHLGKAIVDFVKEHPWPEQIEFRVLNVIEPFPLGSAEPTYATEKLINEGRKAGHAILEMVSAELKKTFPHAHIENVVVSGTPNRTILEAAEAWPADLIVMGSHCCSAVDHILLGSVPLSVAPQAHCSVAIVRLNQPKALEFELSESDLPCHL